MEHRKDLTGRQTEILDFIQHHLRTHGYPPSVREIGKAVGLSSSATVHVHLAAMEEKGWIKRDPSKPRALEVLIPNEEDEREEILKLPLIGQVAAGQPILAEENIEGHFSVSASFLGRGTHFLLRVKGESMVEAGVLDGDLVIVRSQQSANNGDIVVAMIDGDATVKRFYHRIDHVELRPENSAMEPIITREASIVGVVAGLVRRM